MSRVRHNAKSIENRYNSFKILTKLFETFCPLQERPRHFEKVKQYSILWLSTIGDWRLMPKPILAQRVKSVSGNLNSRMQQIRNKSPRMRCAVNRRLLKTLLTSLAPFTWPIRGFRQPGANFNFGAPIFPKILVRGGGGLTIFFRTLKK